MCYYFAFDVCNSVYAMILKVVFVSGCYSGSYENDCKVGNQGDEFDRVYYDKTCTRVEEICKKYLDGASVSGDNLNCMINGNKTLWRKQLKRVLASEEYYK